MNKFKEDVKKLLSAIVIWTVSTALWIFFVKILNGDITLGFFFGGITGGWITAHVWCDKGWW